MADNEWTDELKQEVCEAYTKQNPTQENTMDIVKELAVQYEKTPNGVRMILTKGGVYVKKTPTSTAKGGGEKTTTTRVVKAEAIDTLKKTISDAGKAVDADICDRLTGKAAVYFTGLLG